MINDPSNVYQIHREMPHMGIIKNQEIETIDMHERNCKKMLVPQKLDLE